MAAVAATSSPHPKLVPVASYARIKPVGTDKDGGAAAGAKGIAGFDAGAGSVEVKGARGTKTYSHFAAVIPPDAMQVEVYRTICAPLVAKWLGGFDVDIVSYGQTGSGKTYTMFGPPHAMKQAADALGSGGRETAGGDGVVRDEHGFILRTGFEALAAAHTINGGSGGGRAVLQGSMVEMSILSFGDQTVLDLLAGSKPCYVDAEHHLQGARCVPLRCAADLVAMVAAVEARSTRGTKMNDSSSRSHCMTVFTLHVLEGGSGGGAVRTSRMQFFDMMGSERFKGANAAHDTGASSKATTGGWEGIFANFSLLGLLEAVRAAAAGRRSKKKPLHGMSSVLTNMLNGSLEGHAVTAMVTCLSIHPRNSVESSLSVQYSADMGRLLNAPQPQPCRALAPLLQQAREECAKSAAIVEKGVAGKYQRRRQAELNGWQTTLDTLEELAGGGRPGLMID